MTGKQINNWQTWNCLNKKIIYETSRKCIEIQNSQSEFAVTTADP